ncbi:hypothetical protein RhiirA4_461715 [Rhizophagus irregularis]|uniref:DDE-1 domain-containing protein n=1 Tax=Rhizophagus irregularis TaxID=588596 RepID=A0A2I1GJG3_9GLOM|nr:hypothetical protein RhiirA4_461715 [Rhizophagus irregularis]
MAALYGNPTENFKASFHWLTLFMKRYKLSLCRRIKADRRIIETISAILWFDMAVNFTINAIGDKMVHIHRTGQRKKSLYHYLNLHCQQLVLHYRWKKVTSDLWMDTNMKKGYVDYLDEEGHLEESVKNKFRESDFDLVVIPGRLTSICQPLDVAIKPFKDNLRKEWHL